MFSPKKENIYTELEATYKYSLLKKKAATHISVEALSEFHGISMKTVEILTKNMISTDVPLYKMFEFY